MTLDEAIKHAEEVAKIQENNAKSYPRPNKNVKGSGKKYNACLKRAEEHRQLAEWLKDYKRLLDQEPCEDAVSPTAEPVGFEEAKKLIYQEWKSKVVKDNPNPRLLVAYQIAIKALEQEPCEDCVSRTIVQEGITKSIELKENPHQLWQRIQSLPPVTPVEKTGRWIKQTLSVKPFGEDTVLCDQCGFLTDKDCNEKFCPNCGARMEVEE